jgi:hypothetical protein
MPTEPTIPTEGITINVTLTPSEHSMFLFMCGYACGAVDRDGNPRLFWNFVHVVNRLNEGNPNYTPYEIPTIPTSKEKTQ